MVFTDFRVIEGAAEITVYTRSFPEPPFLWALKNSIQPVVGGHTFSGVTAEYIIRNRERLLPMWWGERSNFTTVSC